VDAVALIGRILFSLLFLGSAFGGQFGATAATAGYGDLEDCRALGSWSCSLVAASSSIISGPTRTRCSGMEMTQFMKDISLAGAALILFVLYAVFGDELGYQIADPLWSLSP
jgi:hypothetical protein